MTKFSISNPLLQIHIAVFLWGFTAILGKIISLPTTELVFLRMAIAMTGFLVLQKTRREVQALKRSQWLQLFSIGVIICVHWLCFYQSIKEYNSASLALICLGTGPMFTLWLEVLTDRSKKFTWINLVISIVALLGIYLIAQGSKSNEFSISEPGRFEWAIFYGLMATLLASIFTILNGRATKDMPPLAISTIEMMAGAICLFLFLAGTNGLEFLTNMSFSDTGYIVILSICCTCVPFLLSIYSLQKLEPFIVTLTVNLEPIYGLIFAGIFWQEYQNFNIYFYLGSFLILFSVFLPMINDRWKRV